jgi:hypothetical protein
MLDVTHADRMDWIDVLVSYFSTRLLISSLVNLLVGASTAILVHLAL